MITDERCAKYIESLDRQLTPLLADIEKRSEESGVPIIRKSARSLIRFALSDIQPENILELGTAVAFSAIFMATYGPKNAHIDTVENYDKRIEEAKRNISLAGMEERIRLIEGDALEVLEELVSSQKSYDMIFIDAAKAQYPNYLPLCRDLLRDGGLLISDNVLFDGDIVQSRFAVRRRDRTIHSRMREYLRMLSEDEEFVTTILPIGDGMTLSVKHGSVTQVRDDGQQKA